VSEPGPANEATPASGPLAGLRVLDLSSVILGPYATMILGDLGADVVKVESPAGDSARYVNPGRHHGISGTAVYLHRNKRSVVLDLKAPEGRAALLRLAATADAVFHNIRPQAMSRLGLAYEDFRAVNPAIVHCVATGFGSDGPYAGQPAYDDLIQGASGIAALMARRHGRPDYYPGTICDKVTAMAAANALIAGLLHRARTGQGQDIEVPMFETMVAFNFVEHVCDFVFAPPGGTFGYARMLSADRRPYQTRDGTLCMLPYTDAQWRAFFAIVGRPDLADDPRFATLTARTANVDTLYALVAEEAARRPTAEWLALCREHQIPAFPVIEPEDLPADPHLRARGFFERRCHPSEGDTRAPGVPVRFSATPGGIARDAPRLGEHTREILREAGLSADEIDDLVRRGVAMDGSGG
jgi:crotonobetainyl-CoA:carnitine CoA-transferase CaiB-like acyl-CoA transferase